MEIEKLEDTLCENEINVKIFGAKGDGVTDDGLAILRAHEYANNLNLKVVYPYGEYLISKASEIPIHTDVDAANAKIIIDDSYEQMKPVFVVKSRKVAFDLPKNKLLNLKIDSDSKNISLFSGNGTALYRIENDTQKVYVRYGINSNSGINLSDMLICDNLGNILNDVVAQFNVVTKVTVFPIDDQKLTLNFGNIISLANVKSDSKEYTKRNIQIRRSNVNISVNHELFEKSPNTAPYAGIIEAIQCAYVKINDSNIQIQPTKGTDRSSYDLNFSEVCSLRLENVKAKNIEKNVYGWGVFGGNLLKDVIIKDSCLNRIDSHTGSHNVSIINSQIGQHGITIIGSGLLYLEKIDFHSNNCVMLREDYGSSWNGPIIMNKINHYPWNINEPVSLLRGDPHPGHEFGYDCHFGTSISIKDYLLHDKNMNIDRIGICRISSFESEIANTVSFYKVPSKLSINNAKTSSKRKCLVAFDAIDFPYCKTTEAGKYKKDILSNSIKPNCFIYLGEDCDWYHDDSVNGCMLFVSMNKAVISYKKSLNLFDDEYTPFIEIYIKNHKNVNLYPYAYPMIIKIEGSTIRRLYAYNDGGSRSIIRVIQSDIEGTSKVGNYGLLRGNPLNMEFLNCTFKPVILSDGTTITNNPEFSKYYSCLDFASTANDFISLLCSIYNCNLDSKIDFNSLKTDMYSYYWDFGTLSTGEKIYKKIGQLSQRPTTNKMGNFYFDSGNNVLYLYTTNWGGYKQI